MKCKVADDKKPHLFIQKAIFNFSFCFFFTRTGSTLTWSIILTLLGFPKPCELASQSANQANAVPLRSLLFV